MPYLTHYCRRCGHRDTMAPESSAFGSVARVVGGALCDAQPVTLPTLLRKSCGQCPACKTENGCDWDPLPGLAPQWYTDGTPVPDDVLYAPGFGVAWPEVLNDATNPKHKAHVTRACACDACRRRYEDITGEPAPSFEYTGPELDRAGNPIKPTEGEAS